MADELDVFHSYVGGFLVCKVSLGRCAIVWCRLLNRLILAEYESIQFCIPVNTFRLHKKFIPVNVCCENHMNTQPIHCRLNAKIFNVIALIQFIPTILIYLLSCYSALCVILYPRFNHLCSWASAALPVWKLLLHTRYNIRVPSETGSGWKSHCHCR
jgi:hypothetical protein